VPAAAVIPAPIVYIKVVAVKKLVVGFRILRIEVFGFNAKCTGSVILYFFGHRSFEPFFPPWTDSDLLTVFGFCSWVWRGGSLGWHSTVPNRLL
jgi:hypothetical protein